MEYYFLAPVGILLSGRERTKEEVKELLTHALQSDSKSMIHYLQQHGVNRAFTFTAPRFKFAFDI